jgi:glycosyltransferase involved in cell wall biosynthesis
MKEKIKISVLMAVYNTDFNLVKRAIDSVLNQSFQNFELIIIDDGSQNDTQYKLLSYVKKHQDKITYIWHTNRGQAQSINRVVPMTEGEFITIIDSDDEYKPHHLSLCLREIGDLDLIASTTDTIVDSEEDYYVSDLLDNTQFVHVDNCILFATLFGKRQVFSNIVFREGYAADADFYRRASKQYRVKKLDLRTYIYYRNIKDSVTAILKQQYLVLS